MAEQVAVCSKCGQSGTSLPRCGRCSTQYCSRVCQTQHWPQHKRQCSRSRADNRSPATGADKGPIQHVLDPFSRLDRGKYLHGRPQQDVYRLLIDTYRLRMDDNDKFEDLREVDSIYASKVNDGQKSFIRFLAKAEAKNGILPSWWTAETRTACEELASTPGDWCLLNKVSKAGIATSYGDEKFPMQLRMLGEAIYSRGIMGQDGTGMRKVLASQEAGRGPLYSSTVDASR
ncbi:zinc finger MYND domain-containing protein [Microdochium nivale]|nr:zinc finger MYND domain-containing protein [Microdochium nivale]